MPGDNFSRRVARAAAVGGGRTYRGQTPLGWYATLLLICVVGVGLIAYSRYERTHPVAAASHSQANVPPTKSNLWEVGLVTDICGKVKPLPASTSPSQPFTTNGHGVVNIEPALASTPASASGKNAILNAFLLPEGVLLSKSTLQIPSPQKVPTSTTSTSSSTTTTTAKSTTTTSGKSTTTSSSSTSSTTTTTVPKPKQYSNGKTCEGKPGSVQVKLWASPSAKTGTIITNNASSLRLKNGQLITIAFLPKGASIPKPPSAHRIAEFLLSNPGGVAPAGAGQPSTSTQITVPASSTPTTTAGGSSSTTATTAAGSSSTTATTTKSKASKKNTG